MQKRVNLHFAATSQKQQPLLTPIAGWPGGKPGVDDSNRPERAAPHPKRVLIFSPHPDDDVISMGGTLARLVRWGGRGGAILRGAGRRF
jgi:glucosamine-6-phosphate deaminase